MRRSLSLTSMRVLPTRSHTPACGWSAGAQPAVRTEWRGPDGRYLKGPPTEAETPEVKACPFCETELRDSVIRCTRCGRSLLPETEPAAQGNGSRPAPEPLGLGAPVVSSGSRGTPAGFPREPPAPAPTSSVWATASARTQATPQPPMPTDLGARRALPTDRRRSARPDLVLLLAGLAAAGAAVLAWKAIGDPWVKLVITDTSDRVDPVLVGDLTLHGNAALVGTIGQGLAVVLGVYAIAWLVLGFDRGSTTPWFTNPAISILASIAGLMGVVLSAVVWFVWEDAAVEHARAVRMTAEELRALLDLQPAPLVEIQQLSGLMRFGGAMVIGLLSACAAWWSYRRRG